MGRDESIKEILERIRDLDCLNACCSADGEVEFLRH